MQNATPRRRLQERIVLTRGTLDITLPTFAGPYPSEPMDELTADDIAARRIYLTLAGPKPFSDPLGEMIPSTTSTETPDSPQHARHRRRYHAGRIRRQLEALAQMTGNTRLLAALRQSHP